MTVRDDILIEPATPAAAGDRPLRVRLAAFVPITIAVLGVAAILLGGISARHEVADAGIDTIVTGTVAGD
ncbi:MAG: hypothetical protein KDK07_25150 [Bauldia sp.]|nr:hypothetical protein [Bauldia sp.]